MNVAERPSNGKTQVLVADNSLIYTQLLAASLEANQDFAVTSHAGGIRELIRQVTSQHFDVIILSSSLDETPLGGCQALREMRLARPAIRVVMLLDSLKREVVVEAFRAGAKGLFTRDQSIDDLAKCIRKVQEGQIWVDSLNLSYAMEALASTPVPRAVDAGGLDLLSSRELEVVSGLARGLTNREIAEQLGLSEHTVKNYLFRIFEKVGVSNRVELLFLTLQQPLHGQDPSTSLRRRVA
jgi:two-component system nitrate/nitrite response regulator NarL